MALTLRLATLHPTGPTLADPPVLTPADPPVLTPADPPVLTPADLSVLRRRTSRALVLATLCSGVLSVALATLALTSAPGLVPWPAVAAGFALFLGFFIPTARSTGVLHRERRQAGRQQSASAELPELFQSSDQLGEQPSEQPELPELPELREQESESDRADVTEPPESPEVSEMLDEPQHAGPAALERLDEIRNLKLHIKTLEKALEEIEALEETLARSQRPGLETPAHHDIDRMLVTIDALRVEMTGDVAAETVLSRVEAAIARLASPSGVARPLLPRVVATQLSDTVQPTETAQPAGIPATVELSQMVDLAGAQVVEQSLLMRAVSAEDAHNEPEAEDPMATAIIEPVLPEPFDDVVMPIPAPLAPQSASRRRGWSRAQRVR